jgi:hypothetical protein
MGTYGELRRVLEMGRNGYKDMKADGSGAGTI